MAALLAAAKAMKIGQNSTQGDNTSSIHQTITIQSHNSNGRYIDFPFNLDEIFLSDVERFGSLKEVLKVIVENLEKQAGKISEVDMKMASKFMLIDKIKISGDQNKESIDKVLQVIKELEQKSNQSEDDVSTLKADVEALRMNFHLSNGRIKTNKENIDKILEQLEQLQGQTVPQIPNIDLGQLSSSSFDLKQLTQIFVSQENFNKLEKRVNEVENNQNKSNQHLDLLEAQVKQQIYQIQNFEQRLLSMNPGQSIVNNTTQNFDQKFIDDKIQALRLEIQSKASMKDLEQLKQLMPDKQYVQKEITRIDKLIERLNQATVSLENLTDKQVKDLEQLKQFVEMISKSITQLRQTISSTSPQNQNRGGVNSEEEALRQQIYERLAFLENELAGLKDEFSRWAKDMQDAVNSKVDLEILKTLEQSLIERLNDSVKALSKQFADKDATRKALKLLEKNLKNMYDLFMSKGNQGGEDDAMFTKKPLGGTSCASCAKDVIDLYGKRVDYLPWGKMPFRDPQERIARVGQGFSKMLSMINPDQLNKFEGGFVQQSPELNNYANYDANQPNLMGLHRETGNQSQVGLMMRNNLPPNGKTTTNFHPSYSKKNLNPGQVAEQGANFIDPRPGSAIVLNNSRPFTRASKNRKGY